MRHRVGAHDGDDCVDGMFKSLEKTAVPKHLDECKAKLLLLVDRSR
jgi:hypothetical protein